MKSKTGYALLPLGALVYLLSVVLQTFTPAIAYSPIFVRPWIIWLLVLVVSIVVNPSIYRTHRFFILMLYALVLAVNVAMGDSYFKKDIAIREICYLLLPVVIYQYCITGEKGDKLSLWVMVTMILIILIESIATFFLDIANPGILRMAFSESVTTTYDRNTYMAQYYKLGMSNYSLPHALPILIPASIYGIKANRGFVREIWFLFLFALLLLVWLSGSATALLLATFITIVSFLTKIGKNKQNVIVLILLLLLLLPFLLHDSLSLRLLDIIGNWVSGNRYFVAKVNALQETILYGNAMGDVASRRDLYLQSLDLFESNILLGTNEAVGNHSTLLDRLSVLGLLGIIIFITFLIKQIQFTTHTIGGQGRFFYYEGIVAGILMLLLKDMDNWETFLVLFTVMPIQIRLVETITTKQTNKEVIQ